MKRVFFLAGLIAVLCLCLTSDSFAVDGFGQNTTGGAGGITVTVTTAADFQTYVETIDTPYIIQVSGTIDLVSLDDGKVRMRSNKTIRGIGESPTIIGSLAFKKGSSNVIIERLNITAPDGYGEGDGISVKEELTDIFITKCTLYGCYDGCIDVSRKTDNVTISWCKFYFNSMINNDRVSLIGNTDKSGDEGTLHVTLHHNWYGALCYQRIPSVRYGRAHVYNNYYNCPGNLYCVRTRLYAECLVENNYFKDVQNPWEQLITSGDPGLLYAAGNVLDNVTWSTHEDPEVFIIPGTDTVFTPPYDYTLGDANDIPTMVQAYAGAGTPYPPHWLYTVYGDFDLSGKVDMSDLATFVDYWLGTSDIADADYYPDGIINFREFSLLAESWLKNE